LLVASVASEMYPVPVAKVRAGQVSLAAVFIVAAAVLYGAGAAFIVSFLTRSSVDVVQRRGLVRIAYNGAAYGLGGGAAGLVAAGLGAGGNVVWLFLQVLGAASAFYLVNIPLVAGIVSLWVREPFPAVLRRSLAWTAPTFGLMA